MPNIPLELQRVPGLQPTEIGIQSRTQSAYRGRALYDQAAQSLSEAGTKIGSGIASAGAAAVNYRDHQQINAGADHGATLFSNLTESWNQTAASADPHDPAVAQKWREEQLEPALEQFQKGFTTEKSQEWASKFVNQMRTHMFAKTEADMSSLAGAAVQETVRNLGNKFSNTAIDDPSAVPAMLNAVDHSIDGIIGANPNLKGADAARVKLEVGEKIKEQIAKSGAFGAITNAQDPEAAAKNFADRYPDYINGAEVHTLARAATAQAKANAANGKAALVYQKQLDTLAVDTARNKTWGDNVSVDASGKTTIKPQFFKDVVKFPMQFPNAPNATDTAKTLLDWGQKQLEAHKVVTDSGTASGLDDRMFAADNPTTAIDVLKAETAGKMSRQDGAMRISLINQRDAEPVKNPLFKPAMQAVDSMLPAYMGSDDALLGKPDPIARIHFLASFLPEYIKEASAGKSPAELLDANDPNSLISRYVKLTAKSLSTTVQNNGGVNLTGPGKSITGVEVKSAPVRVRQNGHTFERQSDGNYKAVD